MKAALHGGRNGAGSRSRPTIVWVPSAERDPADSPLGARGPQGKQVTRKRLPHAFRPIPTRDIWSGA